MSKTKLLSTIVLGIQLGCGAGGELAVGQGGEERVETPTWEQYLATATRDPEGVWIVDGDTPIADAKQLREFYDRHVQPGQLILHRSGGVDARWNEAQKKSLTYCVSKTFGARHATVVSAMAEAAGAWEQAANVKFVYLAEQDDNCTASNPAVLFDVRPVQAGGQYLARAFFPGQSRQTRNVLIDSSAFSMRPPWTLTGVVRHELGHALGFRHEHSRPESGTCFEDQSWRALTPYDSESVMHYPHCNGSNRRDLVLTDYDVQGIRNLYGAPGTPPPPPPTDTPIEVNFRGTLVQNEHDVLGEFPVKPGSQLDVTLTGTGDPDLYVRFDAEPTASEYHCRPYTDGADEKCSLTVPPTAKTAVVLVNGYTRATYDVTVKYFRPAGTAPTPKTESFTGSVAGAERKGHGPLQVKPGSPLKVVMTGTGDPDLYVRFGAAPTITQFDCRPYLDGAQEVCEGEVPQGATAAFLMVRGYRAGTYKLDVTYTSP